MTQDLKLYRLWRTSGVLCTLGALEFGYLAWDRKEWWPLIATVALLVCAGFAIRRATTRRPR